MFGLDSILVNKIVEILSMYSEIQSAAIFGSRARGNYTKTSDIDIAIFAKEITSTKVNLLRYALDDLDTIYKIDIIDFYKLSKEPLKENIINEGIEIYNRLSQR